MTSSLKWPDTGVAVVITLLSMQYITRWYCFSMCACVCVDYAIYQSCFHYLHTRSNACYADFRSRADDLVNTIALPSNAVSDESRQSAIQTYCRCARACVCVMCVCGGGRLQCHVAWTHVILTGVCSGNRLSVYTINVKNTVHSVHRSVTTDIVHTAQRMSKKALYLSQGASL